MDNRSKKICIVNTIDVPFDETNLNKEGLGGSETWAVQLANAFSRRGHTVVVSTAANTHYTMDGVLYINNEEVGILLGREHFDLCIISRFYNDIITQLGDFETCDNVWIQAHDTEIFGESFDTIKDIPHFRGVSTLSAYQERCLYEKNNVSWNYMYRIGNGIDPVLFNDLDTTAKNKRLLFSSAPYRGAGIVKDSVVPQLIKKVEDSGVDFCSYCVPDFEKTEHVNCLGSLAKNELYKEMSERFCWFYPLTADETFCITMLENIMCENDLILPLGFGCTSVIEPFIDDVTMKHYFNKGEKEYKLAVDEAVDRIEESINNHDKGRELRQELKNYVLQNYTWDAIADKWLKTL